MVCHGLFQVKDDLGEHFCCTDHLEQVNHTWPRLLLPRLILHFSGEFCLLIYTLCTTLCLDDEIAFLALHLFHYCEVFTY